MSRSRGWLILILGAAAIVTALLLSKRATPPEIDFTKVTRETIATSLSTNGKVEPIEWLPARAERAGVITRVRIAKGQQVQAGETLVELDTRVAEAELAKAQAAIAQAQVQQQVLEQGGAIAERQQVEQDLSRARLDLDAANKQAAGLEKLVEKHAATQVELDSTRQLQAQLRLRITGLEQRKASLVTGPDKELAKAKLSEAESAARVARTNLDLSVIQAPMDGTVYDFDLKQGAFVNPGDLIARVGRLDKVRVTVYVDEPDLGKLKPGEAVNITWDAMPGHQWKGAVDKLPTQIVKLDTRQVGEVGCVIGNPDRDLLPNANINADIQATEVPNTLVILKEAIRRQGSEMGVFLLNGDRVEWRKISLGVSSYTKSQILSGLNEGDAVALPSDKVIKNGSRVQPVFE